MSKKKDKKKKKKKEAREFLLKQVQDIEIDDRWIDSTYEDLFDEIALYQYELYRADKNFIKKSNKHCWCELACLPMLLLLLSRFSRVRLCATP